MKFNLSRSIIIVVVLAMAALACGGGGTTAAPTNTPMPPVPAVVLGGETRSEEGGFSFRSVPGYDLVNESGIVTMMPPGADPDLGPTINLFGGVAVAGDTAEALMASLGEGTGIVVGPSSPVTVGGQSGLQADISSDSGGTAILGKVVVVVANGQQFIAMGGAPAGQWNTEVAAIFQAVVNSVTLFTPTVASVPVVEPPVTTGAETSQWAYAAYASSEWGTELWTASQATGAPDTTECGDYGTAWASAGSTTQEWIELYYGISVIPTQINIYQSYNPSSVVEVMVSDINASEFTVYTASPAVMECPYILSIDVSSVTTPIAYVHISIDQAIIGDYNEIDAVELVGLAVSGAAPADPSTGSAAFIADSSGYFSYITAFAP